ncbi:hypothetical protein ACFSOZ_34860 [Mesorhizobium newzealandense]|uniref:Uncharacterized protein n=1 Tax=Mesorhizobium newzealandense TaxID=1300302 RepID=A0ABW4UJA9_9HYPH
MPGRESRQSQGGSNHTLFPSARKERAKPCGIFARKRRCAFEGNGNGPESRMFGPPHHSCGPGVPTVAIRAKLAGKSAVLAFSGQTGCGLILYLALARLKVP